VAPGAGRGTIGRPGKEAAVIIKATERSTYVDVAAIDWEPAPWPGIWTKVLYEEPSGRRTILTRMAPGARLPRHRHTGLEQSFILEGSLVDEDGACTAGNFVWRRPGSVHEAWSPDGCLGIGIFESPNEFLE
jgi:anti-sigma factor ChrR (cupin superfamily)